MESTNLKFEKMNEQILKNTISEIFSGCRGILAMDESNPTCNKRFSSAGIEETEEMRRRYRELLVKTTDLNKGIGGAILSDETIHQKTTDGIPMADVLVSRGILPGIKVDQGAKPLAGFPNEKITEGLDGLRDRLSEYKKLGARFAKWRAVITIGKDIPSLGCIEANVHALARYAALCQEADIVPIVEPEVLMDGDHSIEKCYEVTEKVLKMLFYKLYKFNVYMEGIILKPNMVIAGKSSKQRNSVQEVAEATYNCLLSSVPASVPVIAFLSGGQSPTEASEHLNAINKIYRTQLPWIVAFSFARAIQEPALNAWKGKEINTEAAQKILLHRVKLNSEACCGKYNKEQES